MATGLLAPYLERLNLGGPLSSTYATLCGLQHAHQLSIPFENLDILLGRRIALDLPSIAGKLLTRARGGYCFEHNTLFRAVLTELGFETTALAARVHLGLPSGTTPPRTHMCLRVELPEGSFLADAGFGGPGPRHPLALLPGAESAHGHERHRLLRSGDTWLLQAHDQGVFRDLYSFSLEPQRHVDVEVHNHYTSTHPQSRFVQGLLVQRATVDGRVTIRNDTLTVRSGSEVVRSTLGSRDELYQALRDLVGLDVPEVRGLLVPAVPHWR